MAADNLLTPPIDTMIRIGACLNQKARTHIRRKTSDYFLVYDDESGELIGRIADLSLSGMKIISPEPLSAGSNFKFRVSLPEPMDKVDALIVATRSVWARENENAGWHESGHTFQNLEESTVALIARITVKIMAEESGCLNRPKSKR